MYHIEMDESTPVVRLAFQSTIRIPCSTCYVELRIYSHVGLTVSRCVLHFTNSTPQILQLRAVPTAGDNSRILTLKFYTTMVTTSHSLWLGYKVSEIRVIRLCAVHV